MKLKYIFETVELDGEIMAVPVGDGAENLHAMLRLNETGADVLKLLRDETTEEAIVAKMLKLYSTDKEKMTKSVHAFIEKLEAAGVLC